MMTLEKYKEIDTKLISRARDFAEFKAGEPIYRIGDFGYVHEADFIEVCGSEENQTLYVLLANYEGDYDSLEELISAYIDGDLDEDYEPEVVYYTEGEGVFTDEQIDAYRLYLAKCWEDKIPSIDIESYYAKI